jgi:thiamine-phosphate pyrophosphorylase
VVTDDAVVARPDFVGVAAEVMEAGGPLLALHLRAPAACGLAVYRWAEALRACSSGALLLVNDRADVALAAGADGVHLGRRGLSVGDARGLLGPARLIGVSVGSVVEAEPGADFLLVGNVYPTASHPGRAGIGTSGLAGDPPRIAIGGVTPERVAELRRAGARGIAAIRGIWDAPRPAKAVRSFLKEWQG